jgi:CheY-like chemotaxis protein
MVPLALACLPKFLLQECWGAFSFLIYRHFRNEPKRLISAKIFSFRNYRYFRNEEKGSICGRFAFVPYLSIDKERKPYVSTCGADFLRDRAGLPRMGECNHPTWRWAVKRDCDKINVGSYLHIEDDIVIRVYLADDHLAMTYLLSTVVGFMDDMVLVGQSRTGADVARGIQRGDADVVVMDICMPEIDGIEATKQIRQSGQQCKILMYSACDNDADVMRAVDAGADGYLLKNNSVQYFLAAIREIINHEGFWLDEQIRERLTARCQLAMSGSV